MKVFAAALLNVSISLSISQAHAGGITGGGGGITNPDPIDPGAIVRLVQNETKPVLLSWLNSQQEKFTQLSTREQNASPYRKLFAGTPTVFEVIEQTGVDLEMHQPCFDGAREPRDGSVHSRTPGFVCLSPASMAPKLDEANYAAETMALVLHELTHKLGTTEDEATAIQKDAVKVFRRVDLEEFTKQIHAAEAVARYHVNIFDLFVKMPEGFEPTTGSSAIERLTNFFSDLSFSSSSRYGSRFSMLRSDGYALILSNLLRANLAINFKVLEDPKTPAIVRNELTEMLNRAFGSAHEISARDYLVRALNNRVVNGKVFDQVRLQKITSADQIPGQLAQLRDVLNDAAVGLKQLEQARFQTN